MRTFRILLFTCLTAAVGLTSCKKDNDNAAKPDDASELVGTWKMKEQKMEGIKDGKTVLTEIETAGEEFHYRYMQFTADGAVTITDGDELPIEVEKGTYTLKGDKLLVVITDEDGTDEVLFNVSRKGNALTLQGELDFSDFDDDDDFGFDIEGDVIDIDIIRVNMNFEATREDPAKTQHIIFGSWAIEQAEIQGLIDDEVEYSETIKVADGLDASVYTFKADGTMTIFTPGEEDETSSGTYFINDGTLIIDLDDEEEMDFLAFAFDGQKLTLTENFLSIDDLFDVTDELGDDYESYNLILTLSK